ncbi:porin, partial [Salmonella enterica]|nr:porin [Salmonella enterica]
MIIKESVLAASVGVAVALMSFASQAEVTLLKQNTQA